MTRARVAVVCDYPEEGWPSMDLVGEMIFSHLSRGHGRSFDVGLVRPPFRRRATRLPVVGRGRGAANADRLLNRFYDYPRVLRRAARRGEFDLYHLADHSYAQLVHELPPGRAVVTCHDLDTFRCLLDPAGEPRPWWFRAMARRTLGGLRKAAAVACDSAATRDALLAHAVVPADRLHVVHPGTAPECQPGPDPAADAEADRLLGPRGAGRPDLLHVGSNTPRKRVDVLLDVFAEVRRRVPAARLVKVGGRWPAEMDRRADRLGVSDSVVFLPFLSDRAVLAAVYRRASVVLQPSEAEGFGLPVVEALACGVPLLASDLAVLREVGGDAPVFRPVGDVAAWVDAALALLDVSAGSTPSRLARRAAGLAHARLFSWTAHADRLAAVYAGVLARSPRHDPGGENPD